MTNYVIIRMHDNGDDTVLDTVQAKDHSEAMRHYGERFYHAVYDDYSPDCGAHAIRESDYRRIKREERIRLNAARFGAKGHNPARLPN